MKVLLAAAAIGIGILGSMAPATAQYGRPGPGYDDDGYRDRRDYDRRDYDRRDYDRPRAREREYGFDEREYLRCNPDVRRAVERGGMASGAVHYRAYGRKEGRRLSC